jgi:small subunit ribosomal protein S20
MKSLSWKLLIKTNFGLQISFKNRDVLVGFLLFSLIICIGEPGGVAENQPWAWLGGRNFEFKGICFGNSRNWDYFCSPKNVEFMANHKATKKDVRQANKRRDRNRYYGKTTRNAIRDLRAIKEGKEAGEQLPEVASMIDKLAKKGIIHKNKASNLKRKLARKVNTLAAAK